MKQDIDHLLAISSPAEGKQEFSRFLSGKKGDEMQAVGEELHGQLGWIFSDTLTEETARNEIRAFHYFNQTMHHVLTDTAPDTQKALSYFWLDAQSDFSHQICGFNNRAGKTMIDGSAWLDLQISCLHNYAAGLQNQYFSPKTHRMLQQHYAGNLHLYNQPLPGEQPNDIRQKWDFVEALVKPVKYIYATEHHQEKSDNIHYLKDVVRDIGNILSYLHPIRGFENGDIRVAQGSTPHYNIIVKLGEDDRDSLVNLNYHESHSGVNLQGRLYDRNGINQLQPNLLEIAQHQGKEHGLHERVHAVYQDNRLHHPGIYHGRLISLLKLDVVPLGSPDKMEEIYRQRAARAVFELFMLNDFVDLKHPSPIAPQIAPVNAL